MAKRKKPSVSGYFREVFESHPEWLKEKSNDLILAQYRQEHGMAPDAKVKTSIRNNLMNIKSVLRKKKKIGSYARRAKAAPEPVSAAGTPETSLTQRLEQLEAQIDDCMVEARSIDPVKLDDVIKALRRARYEVVWKMG